MSSFKKQQEEIILQIKNANDEIELLEKELIQIQEDKFFYKRKEDTPAFDKTLEKEIKIVNKINFLSNNINSLNNFLENLKNEEVKSIKTRVKMNEVLNELYLGNTRVQASKNVSVSLSIINKWYDDGKNNKDVDSIYFYNNAKIYESFYLDLFYLFKKEFKHKNKIHLLKSFVPDNYPQRLDRFYNDDSSIWFSMLLLRNFNSIYYFGLKGDNFPRLMLLFNKDYHKSNFRLFNDELIVLLRFDNITKVKKEFKLFSPKGNTNLYYVSLGRIDGGKLSANLEILIKNHISCFSNPIKIIK